MSRFRKLVEDIINRELLNADDAIEANKFATPIITDFFGLIKNNIKQIFSDKTASFTIEIGDIVINVILVPNSKPRGAFSQTTYEINIHIPYFEVLLDIDYFTYLLRHELMHYYDYVIVKRNLAKKYTTLADVEKDPRLYSTSDVELSAIYAVCCEYVAKAVKAIIGMNQTLSNDMQVSVIVKYLFRKMLNDEKFSQHWILNTYTKEEKDILYNKILDYICKVIGDKQ